MSAKSAYAVVRIRENSDTTYHASYSIPASDIFFTMATSETDAFNQAGEIGWQLRTESYDSVMAMANPNYGTPSSPMYARPTFVEHTLGGLMKYLLANSDRTPEYVAIRVTCIGDPDVPGAKPYILSWGGTADPFIHPQIICCYAESYADMLATMSMSEDSTIDTFMASIRMRFYPSDIIVMSYDPFQNQSPRIYAALPRSVSPVTVNDPDPVTHSHDLAFPGPARVDDRVMELV